MTKWYIDKITFSIFMLLISSISYSGCITFGVLKEIALRHEENTSWLSIFFVITYIVWFVTVTIGLRTLNRIKEKIISKGNDKEY